jgi:uncharacterized protein (TIGR03067 family)
MYDFYLFLGGAAMLRRLLIPICVVFVVIGIRAAGGEPNGKAMKEEIKKLQGIWQVTKFIDPSEKMAPTEDVEGYTFEFQGDRLTRRLYKDGEGRVEKYIVNPMKKPNWIDIGVRDGIPLGQGIYKIVGDELTICIVVSTDRGKPTPRPTEFKASKQGHTLFILKKVNK